MAKHRHGVRSGKSCAGKSPVRWQDAAMGDKTVQHVLETLEEQREKAELKWANSQARMKARITLRKF